MGSFGPANRINDWIGAALRVEAEVCETFIAGSIPAVASGVGFREVRAEVSLNRAEVCGPEVCLV